MGQPSGTHALTCRYCGKHYQRTNWMVRRNAGLGPDGIRLSDTHLIACARKIAEQATDTTNPARPGGGRA